MTSMIRRLSWALGATVLGLAFGAACTTVSPMPAASATPAPAPEAGSAVGAPLPFVDVTQEAGIQAVHRGEFAMDGEEGYLGVGQAWGDFDNDGWTDLFVTGNLAANALYRNQGDGTFAVFKFYKLNHSCFQKIHGKYVKFILLCFAFLP